MTAAAKTTIAMAAAIRPHGRCWVTTFAGGRVRPLPPGALPRCAVARFEPVPPRDEPLEARPFSGLGSLATAAPRCAADAARAADRAGHLAGGPECGGGTGVPPPLDQPLAPGWGGRDGWGRPRRRR